MTKSHWAEVFGRVCVRVCVCGGVWVKARTHIQEKSLHVVYFLLLCRVLFQCTVICLQPNELLCKSDLFSSKCVSSTFRVRTSGEQRQLSYCLD